MRAIGRYRSHSDSQSTSRREVVLVSIGYNSNWLVVIPRQPRHFDAPPQTDDGGICYGLVFFNPFPMLVDYNAAQIHDPRKQTVKKRLWRKVNWMRLAL